MFKQSADRPAGACWSTKFMFCSSNGASDGVRGQAGLGCSMVGSRMRGAAFRSGVMRKSLLKAQIYVKGIFAIIEI
jgi:hypothetical protein